MRYFLGRMQQFLTVGSLIACILSYDDCSFTHNTPDRYTQDTRAENDQTNGSEGVEILWPQGSRPVSGASFAHGMLVVEASGLRCGLSYKLLVALETTVQRSQGRAEPHSHKDSRAAGHQNKIVSRVEYHISRSSSDTSSKSRHFSPPFPASVRYTDVLGCHVRVSLFVLHTKQNSEVDQGNGQARLHAKSADLVILQTRGLYVDEAQCAETENPNKCSQDAGHWQAEDAQTDCAGRCSPNAHKAQDSENEILNKHRPEADQTQADISVSTEITDTHSTDADESEGAETLTSSAQVYLWIEDEEGVWRGEGPTVNVAAEQRTESISFSWPPDGRSLTLEALVRGGLRARVSGLLKDSQYELVACIDGLTVDVVEIPLEMHGPAGRVFFAARIGDAANLDHGVGVTRHLTSIDLRLKSGRVVARVEKAILVLRRDECVPTEGCIFAVSEAGGGQVHSDVHGSDCFSGGGCVHVIDKEERGKEVDGANVTGEWKADAQASAAGSHVGESDMNRKGNIREQSSLHAGQRADGEAALERQAERQTDRNGQDASTWVHDIAWCSLSEIHNHTCTPGGWRLADSDLEHGLDPDWVCEGLVTGGILNIAVTGDSYARMLFTAMAMVVSGDYIAGGIDRQDIQALRDCLGHANIHQKGCRHKLARPFRGCGGMVQITYLESDMIAESRPRPYTAHRVRGQWRGEQAALLEADYDAFVMSEGRHDWYEPDLSPVHACAQVQHSLFMALSLKSQKN